jgi:hypothetical protein
MESPTRAVVERDAAEEIATRWINERRAARAWINARGSYTGYQAGTVPYEDKPRAQEIWLGLAPQCLRPFRESGVGDIKLRETLIPPTEVPQRIFEMTILFPEAKITTIPRPPKPWTPAQLKHGLTKPANDESLPWLGWQLHIVRERKAILRWLRIDRPGSLSRRLADLPMHAPAREGVKIPFWRAWLGDEPIAIIYPHESITMEEKARILAYFPEAHSIRPNSDPTLETDPRSPLRRGPGK